MSNHTFCFLFSFGIIIHLQPFASYVCVCTFCFGPKCKKGQNPFFTVVSRMDLLVPYSQSLHLLSFCFCFFFIYFVTFTFIDTRIFGVCCQIYTQNERPTSNPYRFFPIAIVILYTFQPLVRSRNTNHKIKSWILLHRTYSIPYTNTYYIQWRLEMFRTSELGLLQSWGSWFKRFCTDFYRFK